MMRMMMSLVAASALASAGIAAPKPLSSAPDALSVQAIHSYARCVADTTPKGARELLAFDYRSPEYHQKMGRISHGHDSQCLGQGQLRFNQLLMAGGLAERLVTKGMTGDRFAASVAYDARRAPLHPKSGADYVGLCLARTQPAAAWALMNTKPATADEDRAFQVLTPNIADCVPAGVKLSLNHPGLRAMIAIASYELIQPATPAQGS